MKSMAHEALHLTAIQLHSIAIAVLENWTAR